MQMNGLCHRELLTIGFPSPTATIFLLSESQSKSFTSPANTEVSNFVLCSGLSHAQTRTFPLLSTKK